MNDWKYFLTRCFHRSMACGPTPQQWAATHRAASEMRGAAGPVAFYLVYGAAVIGACIDNARSAGRALEART